MRLLRKHKIMLNCMLLQVEEKKLNL